MVIGNTSDDSTYEWACELACWRGCIARHETVARTLPNPLTNQLTGADESEGVKVMDRDRGDSIVKPIPFRGG